MKIKLLLISLFVCSMLFSTGCGLLPSEDERLSPPIKERKEIEFKTEVVVKKDIEKKIVLFAQWKAADKIYYTYSAYNAPFLEYRVSEGDYVVPGDILAVLDIGDIDKSLRDMEITYQKQKISYERTLERYKAGIVSQYDIRIAELDFENTTNMYNDLKEEKAGSLLLADAEGTIFSLMNYEKGDMVNTGINIVTLVKNDDIVLQARSSKIRSSPVSVGTYVALESKGQELSGSISSISGTIVTIEPEYMLDEWELGSTVKADIPLESAQGVFVVDRQAVKSYGGRNYVRILVDGVAIEKYVELGISSGRLIEIISGLVEGDIVILN